VGTRLHHFREGYYSHLFLGFRVCLHLPGTERAMGPIKSPETRRCAVYWDLVKLPNR